MLLRYDPLLLKMLTYAMLFAITPRHCHIVGRHTFHDTPFTCCCLPLPLLLPATPCRHVYANYYAITMMLYITPLLLPDTPLRYAIVIRFFAIITDAAYAAFSLLSS